MKTIITRVGDGTKIVLTGDPYQIDNPYVDATSNGLVHVVNRFKDEKHRGPHHHDQGRAQRAGGAGGEPPVSGDAHGPEGEHGQDRSKPLIEYPTVYTFKVMGQQEHGFREYVRQLFHRMMGQEISPDSISEQPSQPGEVRLGHGHRVLLSEEQRRRIYEQLHKERRILYYL